MIVERALRIEGPAPLSAVLTSPPAGSAVGGAPAVLFLSAGLLHRVGPFRLHVELARRLAAAGMTCLRLDVSGIGYSQANRQATATNSATESALMDTRAAMDYLQHRHRVTRFILVGLCSGAEAAHRVAVRDQRVDGAVFLDGYSFPTARYYWHHYWTRATSLTKWRSWCKFKLDAVFRRHDPIVRLRNLADELWDIPTPPKDRLRRELMTLRHRGTRLLFVYAGGTGATSYPEQLADSLPGIVDGDSIQVQFFPEADHSYILAADRERLIERIAHWMAAFREPSR